MGLLDYISQKAKEIPDNAKAAYRGLLAAPEELAALFSPEMRQRVNQAMNTPATLDRDKAVGMAMDYLQTTPAGLLGTFIGKGAKTWNAAKAAEAESLLSKGVDPREVWKQTGTMRGVDGALRQEIPDNAATYADKGRLQHAKEYLSKRGFKGDAATPSIPENIRKEALSFADYKLNNQSVSDVLGHEGLFGAYDDLGHMPIKFQNADGFRGSYDEGRNLITISDPMINDAGASRKSTTLHELQHAIQQREGWARGGSPDKLAMELQAEADLMRNKAKSLFDLSSANDPLDPGRIVKPGARKKGLELERQAQKLSSEANRINEFAGLDHDAYRRLAGEAEARLTQARMNMTMPERLQSYPYDMLDVPQDQLIVRGLLDGPAMSHADEAAQGGGLLGKVDNAGMSAWKQNDVFGNGKQIEHLSPDGKSAVVQQTLPNGKTVFYPADVDATYGWVRPDMYKRFDSFEAAQKSIKGMRISDAAKKRNTELYGNIPNTWKGDAKKVAKKLIDNGFDVSRFSSSTQSKSKYIELADGRKIRLSDHVLPLSYEGADFDFRYGGDISELIGKLK